MTASRVRDLALTGFIIDGKLQRAKGKDERVKSHQRTEEAGLLQGEIGANSQ